MPPLPKNRPAGLAAVILAGGISSRMGKDKAFLPWEGKTLLERQIALARTSGAQTVWISGRRDADYSAFGCTVVHDGVENAGPLAGLTAALREAVKSHTLLLALAVDLPRMSADYLDLLAREANSTNLGVLPKRGAYFEPLAAVYPTSAALAVAEAQMQSRRLALQELAATLVAQGHALARPITPEELPLFANWNEASGPKIGAL